MKLRCGHSRPHEAHGLCSPCYKRWQRRGRPAVVPEPLTRGRSRSRIGRIEDYFELRSWGESRECAALRLGISERTAWRYEQDLRKIRERSTAA